MDQKIIENVFKSLLEYDNDFDKFMFYIKLLDQMIYPSTWLTLFKQLMSLNLKNEIYIVNFL